MSWLESRTGLRSSFDSLTRRLSRPLPPRSFGVTLGSVAIFLILVQAASGGLLAMYYTPSWEGAHASVVRISKDVTFGWLVRSIHVWSAHLLVATALLHLVRTFARGSYAKPREVTWLAGVGLLGLLMAAAFSGQMLPMDDEAVKGAEVAGAYANEMGLAAVVKGGANVGPGMLTRMFAMHVIWVPAGLVVLIAAHVALVGRHRLQGAESLEGSSPGFLRKLGLSIVAVTALLATLAFVFPAGIKSPVETVGPAKPMWMFLSVYQAAKYVSGPLTILLLVGPPLFLVAVPFLPRRLAVTVGVLLLLAAVALGILGAAS